MSVISSANTDPTTSRRGEDIHPHIRYSHLDSIYHAYLHPHAQIWTTRLEDADFIFIYLFICISWLLPHTKMAFVDITRILLRFFSKPSPDLSLLWLEFGDIPTISYICLHLPLHLAVVAGPVPTVYLTATIYPHTHLSLPRRSFPSVYV